MIATCIGCGCDDDHACVDPFDDPCCWIRLDRDTGLGVCNCCGGDVERWDAGNRTPQGVAHHLAYAAP